LQAFYQIIDEETSCDLMEGLLENLADLYSSKTDADGKGASQAEPGHIENVAVSSYGRDGCYKRLAKEEMRSRRKKTHNHSSDTRCSLSVL
jgi:hypothetical protein